MNKQTEKQQLRKTMRALEARLSERYLEQSDRRIAAQLLAMPEYQAAETVFCFVSVGREINTRPVLNAALESGKTLCVPRCLGSGIMELRDSKPGRPRSRCLRDPRTDGRCAAHLCGPGGFRRPSLPDLQPPGPAAGPGRRVLRPVSCLLPGRHRPFVPGKADPGGNSCHTAGLSHSLGADGGRTL